MAITDTQGFIEVKKARIARAGKQTYSRDEILMRGLTPKTEKAVYVENRPAEVVLKHLAKFNNVFFCNDHPPCDVTSENWKDYAVGAVGSNAGIEVTDDGEIFVTNDVVFYDRKAYEDYKSGKVELSAGYDAQTLTVDDPDGAGFDFMLADIPSVNHVALCHKARAGHNARILDSGSVIEDLIGGQAMLGGRFLRALGIGKTKDSAVALSKTVLDAVAKVATLDQAGLEKEVMAVMGNVKMLGDREEKTMLVGIITDSLKNPVEVLAEKDTVAKSIDALYQKCLDADAVAAEALMKSVGDAVKPVEQAAEKPVEKPVASGNMAALVEDAVKKALTGVTDSLKTDVAALVDASVKKALGLTDAPKIPGAPPVTDAVNDDFDASFLVAGIFGQK